MVNIMFLFLHQCKEMIRIVKVWSKSVAWRNSSSTPSQYLLSLLVTAACQVVLGIEYVYSFAAVGSVHRLYKIHNFLGRDIMHSQLFSNRIVSILKTCKYSTGFLFAILCF